MSLMRYYVQPEIIGGVDLGLFNTFAYDPDVLDLGSVVLREAQWEFEGEAERLRALASPIVDMFTEWSQKSFGIHPRRFESAMILPSENIRSATYLHQDPTFEDTLIVGVADHRPTAFVDKCILPGYVYVFNSAAEHSQPLFNNASGRKCILMQAAFDEPVASKFTERNIVELSDEAYGEFMKCHVPK